MLAVEAAQDKILDHIVEALPIESVALADAHGRVLGADVFAPSEEPRVPLAAMDGYAVRASESADESLVVQIECVAGQAASAPLLPGACARIFTGAPLPLGADAVIMQEEAARDGAKVRFLRRATMGQHVRVPGQELRMGERVVEVGTWLGAAAIGVLASLGLTQVKVRRRPTGAIFSTGQELREPGSVRLPHELYDSNRSTLVALFGEHGAQPMSMLPVGDDRPATVERLELLLPYDVICSTGGVSVGDHDHVRAALAEAGFETIFWKVNMKPGKPVVVARRNRQLYFGLPGNPVSAQVGFHLFVRPALRKLLGLAPLSDVPRIVGRLSDAVFVKDDRRQYLRARASVEEDGEIALRVLPRQSSAALITMAYCNALVIVEPEQTYEVGGRAAALLIGPIGR